MLGILFLLCIGMMSVALADFSCTDTDGGDDPEVMGDAVYGDNNKFVESCETTHEDLTPAHLLEYYCGADEVKMKSYACDSCSGMSISTGPQGCSELKQEEGMICYYDSDCKGYYEGELKCKGRICTVPSDEDSSISAAGLVGSDSDSGTTSSRESDEEEEVSIEVEEETDTFESTRGVTTQVEEETDTFESTRGVTTSDEEGEVYECESTADCKEIDSRYKWKCVENVCYQDGLFGKRLPAKTGSGLGMGAAGEDEGWFSKLIEKIFWGRSS